MFPVLADTKRVASRLGEHYEREFKALRSAPSAPPTPLSVDLIPRLYAALKPIFFKPTRRVEYRA